MGNKKMGTKRMTKGLEIREFFSKRVYESIMNSEYFELMAGKITLEEFEALKRGGENK